MNGALKWKLIAGFILVFVAGGLTGAFFAASRTGHLLFAPSHNAIAQRMRQHLRHQLQLTDQQMTKISPIIDKTATELETIRSETGRRVHEAFAQAHREIATELTPEQKTKLQEMEAHHRRMFHRMHGQHESPPVEQSPTALQN
jgi:Spy/CpxP family protein refolding chaperone